MTIFAKLTGKGIRFISQLGELSILIWRMIKSIPLIVKNPHLTSEQMMLMGVNSLPLVIFTSVFTGAVSAVQAAYQFQNFVPMRYLGTAVGKAVIIELGPVLTALVVAGRVGASIAAELGTMKVTEQIDALETMALDPVRYLVVPRFMAGIIMLPVLTIIADLVAILGGLVVAVNFLNLSSYTFLNGVRLFFDLQDLFAGLIKSVSFGGIIAIIGCFQGFRTTGGAEGVGFSTTRAVVLSSILILLTDYAIATIIFG
ncbi:MAG: ABC transporter permease [candidate division Zixibacteria bacterium]